MIKPPAVPGNERIIYNFAASAHDAHTYTIISAVPEKTGAHYVTMQSDECFGSATAQHSSSSRRLHVDDANAYASR